MAVAVAPPQRGGRGAAVHALAPLCGRRARKMDSFRVIYRLPECLFLISSIEVEVMKVEAVIFSMYKI